MSSSLYREQSTGSSRATKPLAVRVRAWCWCKGSIVIDRRMQSPVDTLIARIESKSGLPIMQNVEDEERKRKIVFSSPGVSEIDAKRIIVVVVILFDKVSF